MDLLTPLALALPLLAAAPCPQGAPPLHRRAREAYEAGRALDALAILADGFAATREGGAGLSARRAAELEVDALAWIELTRELEAWPEALAALERAVAAALPPKVDFLLRYLRAECLCSSGRFAEARAEIDALGFTSDYLLIGPFDNERGSGLNVAYPPESSFDWLQAVPGKERDVQWRANPAPDHPLARIALDELFRPREQVVCYLATALRSDAPETEGTGEPRTVVLRIGSSAAVKVLLNGREVYAHAVERPRFPDQDLVVLRLRSGWNQLLIKTGVESGLWSLETRFTDLAGRPARSLSVDSRQVATATPPVDPVDPAEPSDRGAPAPEAREILEGLPTDPEAQRSLALYHLIAHPEDRVATFDREAAGRARALDPRDLYGIYLHSRTLAPRGRTRSEVAIHPQVRALEEVLETNPEHVWALLDLAQVSQTLNPLPQRADRLTREALELAPESWRALRSRSRYLGGAEREVERLLLDLRAAESPEGRLRSTGAVIRFERELEAGRPETAVAELQRAFERSPADAAVLALLVDRHVDLGETEKALERIHRTLSAEPFAVSTLLRSAERLEHAGAQEAGRELVLAALRVCPEDTTALRQLARLDVRAGDLQSAAERLDRILALDPGRTDVRRQRQLLLREEESEHFEGPWRRDAAQLVGAPLPAAGQNDSVEVLERTTVYRVYTDGAESRYEHYVVRALNQAGVQALDRYAIGYPVGGALQTLAVRVLHPDGSFERAPAPRRDDVRQGERRFRVFDLPPLGPGDVVDVEYRVDETEPDVFGKYFGVRHAFYPDVVDALAPTRYSELAVIAPPELPLYAAERRTAGLEKDVSKDADGNTVMRWVARDLARPPLESGMPRREELVPIVDITTYPDWNAFGRWWWSFIEKEFDTSPAMLAKVSELIEGAASESERVARILRFVAQEIRYNSWPFGTHGYEPFSASTIFERRFGDCKDKSILLRQMLAQIGVDAIPVLIKAQYGHARDDLDVAMVEHFNHCIAYVTPTPERDGYYLDATADRNPIDYLRADDQGARVLHVAAGGVELHDIPYAPAADNVLHRSYDVRLDASGSGDVSLVDESTGQFGVALRYRFGGERGDLEKSLSEVLSDTFGQVEFRAIETSVLEDIREPAWLRATFAADRLWTEAGTLKGLRLGFDELGLERLAIEAPSSRSYDLVLERPRTLRTSVRWHLPEGGRVSARPDDVAVELPGYFEYALEVVDEDGSIEVRRRFTVYAPRVPLHDYGAFHAALEEVRRAEKGRLLIELEGEGR